MVDIPELRIRIAQIDNVLCKNIRPRKEREALNQERQLWINAIVEIKQKGFYLFNQGGIKNEQ